MVTVGQAAVVTVVVAVSTGHPEGMAGGKGCSFWAVQWIGVIMLKLKASIKHFLTTVNMIDE